jgi:hypothetical protein
MSLFRGREALFDQASSQPAPKESGPTIDTDIRRTSPLLGGLALVGAGTLFVWAENRPAGGVLAAFSLGLLILGSAALVGGVFGLLFGIPKSVSDPAAALARQSSTEGGGDAGSAAAAAPRASYAANTNLEQISDWLTKIMVGVGLTEIATIRTQFLALADYLGNGFAVGSPAVAGSAAPVVAIVIVVYGLTSGFLAGYLLTRMFLPGAFVRADEALRRRNTELVTQIAQERETTQISFRAQAEIYNDLYRYEEEGFRKAISKVEELFTSPQYRKNPALWAYLAAAHGQAWQWENAHRPDSDPAKGEILKQHRDAALAAVNSALTLGNEWKPVLQLMWDRNHPAKRGPTKSDEDDLEVFYDDPAFRSLLG